MEYVYFARPDSDIEGINVHQARKQCGQILAAEAPAPGADIVVGVPDSGMSAAIGYAEAAGIPFEIGMIKNKYIGRTFIQPSQALREQGVKMKLSAVRSIVGGKSVVLIDDSIVRGTTMAKIVQMIRDAGAREVHVRIASPTIKFPCFYGVAFSTYAELISARVPVEGVQEIIGADSLGFLSVEGLTQGVGRSPDLGEEGGQCTACFTGNYPTYLYEDAMQENIEVK
jgi:amidophosphoribosyltransferase